MKGRWIAIAALTACGALADSKPVAPTPNELGAPEKQKFTQGIDKSEADQGKSQPAPIVVQVVQPIKSQEERDQEKIDRDERTANDNKMYVVTCLLVAVAFFQLVALGLSVWTTWRQLRAYMYVVGTGPINNLIGGKANITITIKNSGQTPAYHVFGKAFIDILPLPLPDKFNFPKHRTQSLVSKSTIFSGTDGNMLIGHAAVRFSEDQIKEISTKDSGVGLYIFGEIEYRDTFKVFRRTTKFCRFIYPHEIAAAIPDPSIPFIFYPTNLGLTDQHNEAT